jgi:hypothetical protein
MLYVFKSSAGAGVTYTGDIAEQILRLAGKAPGKRGVIAAAELDEVIARLARASAPASPGVSHDNDADGEREVPFAHRLPPFLELLRSARAAGKDVTWGI